jgi:hypothetical protein
MNAALEDALIDLLVQRWQARWPASIVDWAADALVAGEDTPPLVILAGLEPGTGAILAPRYVRTDETPSLADGTAALVSAAG